MTKYIFVTGGVCSSLGKGITAASIGALLKASGYKVFMQKLDPYLNVDPGTMSPFQHGEVFVTDDGAETDLDLGHYERFIDTNLSKYSTVTTGKVYSEVLENERKGSYGGKTVQIIPHITDKIIEKVKAASESSKADFVIVEIGGTVGDIEGEPYLEAIRQIRFREGKENTLFVHLTLLPYLAGAKELKTKPTQLSVRDLRRVGISPDLIIARADKPISKELIEKISLFCDVEKEAVIPAKTSSSIYKVPGKFEKSGMSKVIHKKLGMKYKKPNMSKWEAYKEKLYSAKEELNIGIAVKYHGLEDAYLSVIEALGAAGIYNGKKIVLEWIDTEAIENGDKEEYKKLKNCAGICVPGGFGNRGTEGKIQVAKFCRENKVPYLGLCLGSQILAIEFARSIGLEDAHSEEFDNKTPNQIFKFLPDQHEEKDIGGTLRLGSYPCKIKPGTLAEKCYGANLIDERHRHRYEFNNEFKEQLASKGLVISGTSPDGNLMEIVEIKDHPFMIGSQFHPEFKSRPYEAHPLFDGFIKACV